MTAREKFTLNQRVHMTDEARAVVGRKRAGVSSAGIVRGFGRQPHLVRIQRDGYQTVESWDASYWDVLSE